VCVCVCVCVYVCKYRYNLILIIGNNNLADLNAGQYNRTKSARITEVKITIINKSLR